MEPSIFQQISTKIEELNTLLDTANAQALPAKEVSAKQKLSAKMATVFDNILAELQLKPTLYADRFDRRQLAEWQNIYANSPALTRDLQNCINKVEGLRISTGQLMNYKMNRLYSILSADVVDIPNLKPLYDVFVNHYKRGPRNSNGGNGDNNGTPDGNLPDSQPPTT